MTLSPLTSKRIVDLWDTAFNYYANGDISWRQYVNITYLLRLQMYRLYLCALLRYAVQKEEK